MDQLAKKLMGISNLNAGCGSIGSIGLWIPGGPGWINKQKQEWVSAIWVLGKSPFKIAPNLKKK